MNHIKSSQEFQKNTFSLINNMVATDRFRFNIYVPSLSLNQDVVSGGAFDSMNQDYAEKFWSVDPMHPSHFEHTDKVVVSNSMLMTDEEWQQTEIFQELFKNHGFFHNTDMFFRNDGKIVAVLTLLRRNKNNPFNTEELELLTKVHSYIQYCLNQIYIPKRTHDRQSLSEMYDLTSRELDVVEVAITGASNKVLVRQLNIGLPTLRSHLQNIYLKVDVHSHSELISKLLLSL